MKKAEVHSEDANLLLSPVHLCLVHQDDGNAHVLSEESFDDKTCSLHFMQSLNSAGAKPFCDFGLTCVDLQYFPPLCVFLISAIMSA